MSSSVISVTAFANSTALKTDENVTFTLAVDAPVQVRAATDGSLPTLALSNGAFASYISTSQGNTALTFSYTVASGGDTADLQIVSLDLNGAGISNLGSDSTFQALKQYNTGLGPESVVVKDVNGDGNVDLVTANYRSATVSVLLSDGVGGFNAKVDFTTGNSPQFVVVEDVNGDGNPDLVVANTGSASVSVLLGDGLGGFSAKTDFTTGSTPGSVAVADVNADGKADLVTANPGDTVSVLLGDGLGGFVRTDFAAGARPKSVAVADVNGDGNLDLLTANSYNETVSVLLGDGLGGFGARTDFATGHNSQFVVVEDVNGDGNADLLVANTDSNTVSVLLNNGLGGFGVRTDYATNSGPRSVAAADVDGDGNLDLVTANSASDTVSILLGDGVGGFGAKTDLATGDNPFSVVVADVDGDGRADLVTADVNSSTVSVLLGTGTPLDASGLAGLVGSDTGLEIDTIAPSAPNALAIAPGSDSGIAGDGVTSDSTPTLTGTAEAGSTVTLFDGASVLGTTLVNGARQWSFTPTSRLAEGGHILSATATDPAGNASRASAALAFIIDSATPPVPSSLTLAPASDSGILGDGITSDSTPTLTGTAEASSTVTLADGASVLGTTQADSAGLWSFTPVTTLANGAHSITATAADTAGNASPASAALAFIIDSATPPVPSGLTLAPTSDSGILGDGITSDSTPTLTGTAEASSTVTLADGASVLGTTQEDSAGLWSFTPVTTLANGARSITATATDAAGNASPASAALAFIIDSATPPVPSGLTLALASDSGTAGDDITSDNTPTLTGTAEAGSIVTLFDGTTFVGTTMADQNGAWSFTAGTLADGNHQIAATATDAAGNVSPQAQTFALNIDTSAPAVTAALVHGVAGPASQFTTDPTLTGKGDPNATVTITEGNTTLGTATANAQGSWTFAPANLGDGAHTLVATESDAAGNARAAQVGFTLDTTAPVAPGALTLALASDTGTPGDGITSVTTPTLVGTAETDSTVTLYNGTTVLGTAVADQNGAWSFTAGTLADGNHQVTATATDPVDNVSIPSLPLILSIDTAQPAITTALLNDTGLSRTDGITADPTLTGTGDPNATVTITKGNNALGTALADAQGRWTFKPLGLADGAHTLEIVETDAAGNASTVQLTLTLDSSAPAAVTLIKLASAADSGMRGDGITNVATPTFAGTAEPGSSVTLYNGNTALGTAAVAPDGTWSFTSGLLTDGAHQITASISDQAGNVSPSSNAFSLTVDTVPPALTAGLLNDTGTSATDRITADATLSGSGDLNASVTISEGTGAVGTATADTNGIWTFAPKSLAQGVHNLTVSETDAANNTSTAQISLRLDPQSAAAPTDFITVSPTNIGIARFFDTVTGTQFYTSSLSEYNAILTNRPDLKQESNDLNALNPNTVATDPDAVPVYRFFDSTCGTHFFTASTGERDNVNATRPDLQFEGVGFFEHTAPQVGDTAVYRFFDGHNGTHFYTTSETERASILTTQANLVDEGICFYAPKVG